MAEHRDDIEKFYGGVLGANVFDCGGVGNYLIISFDEGFPSQSLVLNEAEDYMRAPGFDHVGLEFDTYEEVDTLIAACKASKEPRIAASNLALESAPKEWRDIGLAVSPPAKVALGCLCRTQAIQSRIYEMLIGCP